jgi:hypothetical protein
VASAQTLTSIFMKNRWLLNIGLVLLVGALVVLAIYQPGRKKPEPGTPLTNLTPDSVQQIRLQRPGQPEIDLEKTGDDWRMTAPRTARANAFRLAELTRLASFPVKVRFPAVTAELNRYGLDHPLATVFLNGAEIRFGAMHPLNNELYILHDNQVQLIPAGVLRTAIAPLTDLLSTSLLEDKTKILALQLPGFSLRQNDQGAWVRTPEIKQLASDRVNQFVDEWRYARALSVTPYSGQAATEQVVITVANGAKPRTVRLGVLARKPELVLVRYDEKLEYHFPAETGKSLMQLQPDAVPPAGRSAPAS